MGRNNDRAVTRDEYESYAIDRMSRDSELPTSPRTSSRYGSEPPQRNPCPHRTGCAVGISAQSRPGCPLRKDHVARRERREPQLARENLEVGGREPRKNWIAPSRAAIIINSH